MKCPTCNVPLQMSERQGIEIDYCPQCRGVWLDRGELDKIIERAIPASSAPPSYANPGQERHDHPGGYDHARYRQHEHDRKKKHKSFLGELFDFD